MITGAHAILYSTDAEADRTFLRDVLELPFVDAGHGWLIFALPPAEVAVHPAQSSGTHELYLTCDDVAGIVERMTGLGVACTAPGSPDDRRKPEVRVARRNCCVAPELLRDRRAVGRANDLHRTSTGSPHASAAATPSVLSRARADTTPVPRPSERTRT